MTEGNRNHGYSRWVLKWTIGWATGGLGAFAFLGLLVGSAVATRSVVPGARFASAILWLAGPANSVLALAADLIARVGSRTRQLSAEEYDWANAEVFAGALPPRERLFVTNSIGASDRAFTFPRLDGKITLNLGRSGFAAPRRAGRQTGNGYGNIFIHELVHACQFSRAGLTAALLGDAISSQMLDALGTSAYEYGPAGFDYAELNLEAQAQVVSDWFSGRRASGTNHTGIPKDPNSPYFRYIAEDLREWRF